MIGSLNIAETRMHELLERYGAELFAAAGDQLLDYSERWMRSEIQEIPNGVYHFQDCMEDDGVTDQPVWMRLKLIVKDDEIIADWTDSDAQAAGPVNATFVVTAAATYSAVLHVTNKDIPVNSGCYRPIRLITNPGTVVNVQHPGPSVGGNTPASAKRRHGGAEPSGSRKGGSSRSRHGVQLPVWRSAPGNGRILYELSL